MTARYRARAKIRVTLTADPLAGDLRDSAETSGWRDLHEHVVAVHFGPQGAGHVAVAARRGPAGVDLHGDPPVAGSCLLVDRGEDVTGGATSSVVTGKDRCLGAWRPAGQVTQLAVIPVPFARADAKIVGWSSRRRRAAGE